MGCRRDRNEKSSQVKSVVRDATMIREQVQSLRQRVCTAHAGAGPRFTWWTHRTPWCGQPSLPQVQVQTLWIHLSKCNGSVWAARLYLAFSLVLEQTGRITLGNLLVPNQTEIRGQAVRENATRDTSPQRESAHGTVTAGSLPLLAPRHQSAHGTVTAGSLRPLPPPS